MNQYTNSFNCAASNGNSEVVIRFGQRGPNFNNETGHIDGIKEEEIITLVMSSKMARALSSLIDELLSDENEALDEENETIELTEHQANIEG